MSATYLLLNLFFSLLGTAYFIYGKKQAELWFMIAGVGLTFYSWAVGDLLLIFIVGAVLAALPFIMDRYLS